MLLFPQSTSVTGDSSADFCAFKMSRSSDRKKKLKKLLWCRWLAAEARAGKLAQMRGISSTDLLSGGQDPLILLPAPINRSGWDSYRSDFRKRDTNCIFSQRQWESSSQDPKAFTAANNDTFGSIPYKRKSYNLAKLEQCESCLDLIQMLSNNFRNLTKVWGKSSCQATRRNAVYCLRTWFSRSRKFQLIRCLISDIRCHCRQRSEVWSVKYERTNAQLATAAQLTAFSLQVTAYRLQLTVTAYSYSFWLSCFCYRKEQIP